MTRYEGAPERPTRSTTTTGDDLARDGGGLRKHRRRPFVALDAEVIYNPDLSMRAKLLLAQMLDRPEGWRFSIDWFATRSTEGRDAVRAAGRELKRHGFYRVEAHRLPDGRVVSVAQVADFVVDEWVEDFARYGERPIPHAVSPDGVVRRLPARGDLTPVAEPSVSESSPNTDDGFSGAGSPGAGMPGVGGPGVFLQTETPDGNQVVGSTQPLTTRATPEPVEKQPRGGEKVPEWKRPVRAVPVPDSVRELARRRSRSGPRDRGGPQDFLSSTPAYEDRDTRRAELNAEHQAWLAEQAERMRRDAEAVEAERVHREEQIRAQERVEDREESHAPA